MSYALILEIFAGNALHTSHAGLKASELFCAVDL